MSGSGGKKRKRNSDGKFCKKTENEDEDHVTSEEEENDEETPMLKRDSVQVPEPGCSRPTVGQHRSAADLRKEMKESADNPTPEQVGVGLGEVNSSQGVGQEANAQQQLPNQQGPNTRQNSAAASAATPQRQEFNTWGANAAGPSNNSRQGDSGPQAVPRRTLPEPGTRAWRRVTSSVDGVTLSRHPLINARPVRASQATVDGVISANNQEVEALVRPQATPSASGIAAGDWGALLNREDHLGEPDRTRLDEYGQNPQLATVVLRRPARFIPPYSTSQNCRMDQGLTLIKIIPPHLWRNDHGYTCGHMKSLYVFCKDYTNFVSQIYAATYHWSDTCDLYPTAGVTRQTMSFLGRPCKEWPDIYVSLQLAQDRHFAIDDTHRHLRKIPSPKHWRFGDGTYCYEEDSFTNGPPFLTVVRNDLKSQILQQDEFKFWDPFGALPTLGGRGTDAEIRMVPWSSVNSAPRDLGGLFPDY